MDHNNKGTKSDNPNDIPYKAIQHQMNTIHTPELQAPLYEALIQYAYSNQYSFHVPGHKDGSAYTEILKENGINENNTQTDNMIPIDQTKGKLNLDYFKNILQLDVTEVTGTDDLHHPEGPIKQGQELAARCFGAEETHWLVGGSTAGNLALILTVCCRPGDLILVQRNVHKSILNGLMLAGARAVFLMPELEPQSGLAVIPSLSTIRAALQHYPEAKAVMLTSPNYYGMSTDLADIADICHEHGLPLLIDEAHGAHYGRHHRFPDSALEAGADAVVQSTHKMLTAMTMGAMLHIQGPYIQRSLLKQRLTMIQSSSPSYPIMASLDISRYILDRYGESLFEQALQARDRVVEGLQDIPSLDWLRPELKAQISLETAANVDTLTNLDILTKKSDLNQSKTDPENHPGSKGIYTSQDPFKLVIYDTTGYLSGSQLQEQLEQYGCIPEMCDDRFVVLAFGPGSVLEDADSLLAALQAIADRNPLTGEKRPESMLVEPQHTVPSNEENPREKGSSKPKNVLSAVYDAKTVDDAVVHQLFAVHVPEPVAFTLEPADENQVESIPLELAENRIAAEMVIPYPPGIPILYSGEKIHTNLLQQLLVVRQHGLKVQGAADTELGYIMVYKQEDIIAQQR